jgi:hypothetical protein
MPVIDALKVKKGDKVSRGQTIGAVRAADPSFLHFEVRKGVDSLDPMSPPRSVPARSSTSSTMWSIIALVGHHCGPAGRPDRPCPCPPAAGEADVGHQRLAGAVHHAADDRQADRRA